MDVLKFLLKAMNVDVDFLREAQRTAGGRERGLGDLEQTCA